MELSLIGLQAAGKTSLVNVIATGSFQENMIPTVGFNMRKVTKGSVVIKLWDLGGQVTPCAPHCLVESKSISCRATSICKPSCLLTNVKLEMTELVKLAEGAGHPPR